MENVNQPIDLDQLLITHNVEETRFEASVGNERAIVEYDLRDGVYAITHTYTPAAFRGYGIAGKLTKFALDTIQAEGGRVKPLCWYAKGYIERHPEYQPLLVNE